MTTRPPLRAVRRGLAPPAKPPANPAGTAPPERSLRPLLGGLGVLVCLALLATAGLKSYRDLEKAELKKGIRPHGIFSSPESDGAVLDSNALLAMFVYLLATWAIVRLIWLLFDRPETGVRRSVHEQRRDVI